MATTNRFISLNPGHLRIGKVVEAASSTANDRVELRMQTINGTTNTNLTTKDILQALKVFEQYLVRGGINEFMNNVPGTGALPQPAPGPTEV